MSIFSSIEWDDTSLKFAPPIHERNKGWWERCSCDCHRAPRGMVMHVMACCQSGWKLTFTGLIGRQRRREAEQRLKRMKERRQGLFYKPSHGGYPGA